MKNKFDMTLEEEAKEYRKITANQMSIEEQAFLAGVNSNYVKRLIIEKQIEVIDDITKRANAMNFSLVFVNARYELSQQLKEL